jgi:hypothetical protein
MRVTLLKEIEAFLVLSGTSASRFGRRAANDPKLVQDIRKGRRPGCDLRAIIAAYMTGESKHGER